MSVLFGPDNDGLFGHLCYLILLGVQGAKLALAFFLENHHREEEWGESATNSPKKLIPKLLRD